MKEPLPAWSSPGNGSPGIWLFHFFCFIFVVDSCVFKLDFGTGMEICTLEWCQCFCCIHTHMHTYIQIFFINLNYVFFFSKHSFFVSNVILTTQPSSFLSISLPIIYVLIIANISYWRRWPKCWGAKTFPWKASKRCRIADQWSINERC